MRKKYILGLLAILMMTLGIVGYRQMQMRSTVLKILGGGEPVPCIVVNTEHSANTVQLWQNEADGSGYFFLPSFVQGQRFMVGDLGANSLRIDGEPMEEGDVFTWEDERAYELQVTDEAHETHTYTVAFMESENIPAIFIDTASGSMEYLDADKEREETGAISVVDQNGNTEYQGALERISGRGNSSWNFVKKPYTIKLTEPYPLCGLEKGNKWNLLSLWNEGSKLNNKIAMDLAEELEFAYSPQGTWVDLYLNGEYAGNYLLTESVSVGQGRVEIVDMEKENRGYNADIDSAARYRSGGGKNKGYLIENGNNITGGYLIEKEFGNYYKLDSSGFETFNKNKFVIKSPQHASREQVQYIQDYVENIERLVQNGQPEVWDYLDADSFVKRFLVDEISLDMDTGITSMYFYKDRNDDKLYSGPIWDYDNAFGECDTWNAYDYQYTVLKNCTDIENHLDWYPKLYDTPEMQQRLMEKYGRLMPFFESLLGRKIDEYVDMIHASVDMDHCRWVDWEKLDLQEWRYLDYDANVSYTKYFIARRLDWLCDRWGVEHEAFPIPNNGQTHTVTFIVDGKEIGSMEVEDGAELVDMPAYDSALYSEWSNKYTGWVYRRQVPVYEDTVFCCARRK